MNPYPRFQRGGFRGGPQQNFNNQRGRGYGNFNAHNGPLVPRQNAPNFGRGRGRGGYPNNGVSSTNANSFRGGRQQSTFRQYGYEEGSQRGQFDIAEARYSKTNTYYTSRGASNMPKPQNNQTFQSKYTWNKNAQSKEDTNSKTNEESNVDTNEDTNVESIEESNAETNEDTGEESYDYNAEAERFEGQFEEGDQEEEELKTHEDEDSTEVENSDPSDNEAQKADLSTTKITEEEDESNQIETTSTDTLDVEKVNEAKPSKKKEQVDVENVGIKEEKEEEDDVEEEDDSSSDEDTDFCKYCKLKFQSAKAYHTHTRGIQHTTLVMAAKAAKGNKHYQKEKVDPDVLKVKIPEPKTESVEPEDEEIDFNKMNWMEMDLDEDVKQNIINKRKTRPEDRDLNPDDIGKSQFTDMYTCPLCDIKCTGAVTFKMHVEGKQHKNNIEQAHRGGPLKKKKAAGGGILVDCTRTPKLTEQLKSVTQPIIGLEYITEFQKPEKNAQPRYVCNLCESKCDATTVTAHLTGLKHRLKYFQQKRPDIYDHLTRFTSKKKRSELNLSADEYALQIEEEIGRPEVKLKIHLEETEEDLKESMQMTSEAIKEVVADMEKKSSQRKDYSPPPDKKMRYDQGDDYQNDYYNRGPPRHQPWGPPRDSYREPPRGPPRDSYREPPRGPPRYSYREPPRDPYRDPPRDPYREPPRDPYRDPPRDPYRDPLRDPPRDSYRETLRGHPRDQRDYYGRYPDSHYVDDNRVHPYDAAYRARFAYSYKDPYYDRMVYDERERLDAMMERRHRLNDPLLERQRVDDIIARREYLDRQEQKRVEDILERRRKLQPDADREERSRLDDILERRRRLQPKSDRLDDIIERRRHLQPEFEKQSQAEKNDVDYERLKRFENRALPTRESSSTRPGYEERPDMEELIARRRVMDLSERPRVQTDAETRQSIYPNQTATPKASQTQQQKEQAVKALQEIVAQNPNVNVAEIMSKLKSSLIKNENDSAMALEISNVLSQALLQYTLQPSKQIQPVAETFMAAPPPEPSIPGFGSGTTSSTPSSHVPSFLRTTAAESGHTWSSTAQQYTNPYYQSGQSTAPYLQTTQSYVQSTNYSAPQTSSYSQQSQVQAPAVSQTVLQLKSPVSQLTYSQAAKLPALVQSVMASTSSLSTVTQTPRETPATADKLLESIRKQTELLKQRLASVNNIQGNGTSSQPAQNNYR